MFNKLLLFLTVICIGLSIGNSSAIAGLNPGTYLEDMNGFSMTWGWDIEEADTWSYTDIYWYSSLTIADGGSNWDVTWEFEHIKDVPASEGSAPRGHPLQDFTFYGSASFVKNTTGQVVFDTGFNSHPNRNCLNCHPSGGETSTPTEWEWESDQWTFSINISENPAENVISMSTQGGFAVVPEPISAILFITGGATLGCRRFWKKKRNS